MFMYSIVNERLTFELIIKKYEKIYLFIFLVNLTLLILANSFEPLYALKFIIASYSNHKCNYNALSKKKKNFFFFSKFAFIVNSYLFYLSYYII